MKNIKTFRNFINESLNLKNPVESQFYKKALKNWNPSRYKELFQKYSTGIYKLDKSKTRIYFPLVKISQSQEETKNTIIDILEENGYTVIDYLNGEVVNPKKKIVKIDVAFNTLGFLELKNRYKEDIVEHKKSKTFSVVISRLPYDIVGMSAHRRWSAYSCMSLYNNEGRYAEQYLPMDVKQGSLVAYLIRSEDTKILDPLARLTIRPYIGDKESDIVFDNATKVYLDDSDNDAKNNKNLFIKRVEEWILDVHESQDLSGIFQIKSGLYKDESNEMLNLANEEFKEKAAKYAENNALFKKDQEAGLIPSSMIIYMLSNGWTNPSYLTKDTIKKISVVTYLTENYNWALENYDDRDIKLTPEGFKIVFNDEENMSENISYIVGKFVKNRISEKELLFAFNVSKYKFQFIYSFIGITTEGNLKKYYNLFSEMLSHGNYITPLRELAKRFNLDLLRETKYLDLILKYAPSVLYIKISQLEFDEFKTVIDYYINITDYGSIDPVFVMMNNKKEYQKQCEYIIDNLPLEGIKSFINDKLLDKEWLSYVAKKYPILKKEYNVTFKDM